MENSDIDKLKIALASGKKVVWRPEDDSAYEIRAIGKSPSDDPEDEQWEPSEVAYYRDPKHRYVALNNCLLSEFKILEDIK
jgi:hypothetical protein